MLFLARWILLGKDKFLLLLLKYINFLNNKVRLTLLMKNEAINVCLFILQTRRNILQYGV